MAEGSANYHEPYEILGPATRDMHRALVSVMEELEAIDWYQQRVDAADDPDLKAILLHNKDEEVEHALMGLEWIRRKSPAFDAMMRRYLFTEGPVVAVEEAAEEGGDQESGPADGTGGIHIAPSPSLGIGSLKSEAPQE